MKPNITYKEYQPAQGLRDYISAYWHFSVDIKGVKPIDILPDGCFDLLLVFKDNLLTDTKLTGIWCNPVTVHYTGNLEVLGIRFKPLAIGNIFKFTIARYLNQSVAFPLQEINLEEQTVTAHLHTSPACLVDYLNQRLMKAITGKMPDPRLKKCFGLVDASAGCQPVGQISAHIGISTRQLHRKVTQMIGLSLKDYSRIVRFYQTLHHIKHNKADYFHYYDQSHFIRDVKHFSGTTPENLNFGNNDRFVQYYEFSGQ